MNDKRKISLSTTLGATVAWYDFTIFNIAVVLIFPQLFFPEMGALIPILAFAVGFLFRPLGSMIFGVLGDRFGRKITLIATLYMTGISTVAIGLLPSFDHIGIVATVLLVLARICQTAAVGGEWAAASVMLSEHHADSRRRGFVTSFVNSSFAIANIIAAVIFMLALAPGKEFFNDWGWRIPFLLSAVLLVIGVYIRRHVLETPEFSDMRNKDLQSPNPLKQVFREHWKIILALAVAISLPAAWNYGIMVFAAGHMIKLGLIDRPDLMQAQLTFWPLFFAAMVAVGWLSDYVSKNAIMWSSIVASTVLAWPVWSLIEQGHAFSAMAALVLLAAPSIAIAPAFFVQIFPTAVRQTGSGISYNLGFVLSGLVPLLAQQVISLGGEIFAIAAIYLALTALAAAAIFFLARQQTQ